MRHFSFLILVIASGLFVRAQSPNILLIIADDLGVDALNGYNLGSINPTTPHLDSLRNNGLTFTNVWSSPVCSPTRAGIMSGKYGIKNGVKTVPGDLDTAHISILNSVKDTNSNYTTAIIGKWHIAKLNDLFHPIWHGADHFMGIMGAGCSTAYDDWDKTENGITVNVTDYATRYFTNDAISWINNQNQPWILWLSHAAPHGPLHVPPSYMHSQPSTNSQMKKYMAMIESLDYEVGRLLDPLSASEKASTTIIFIGDNGTPNNLLQDYPSDRGKGTLYQGGIHVPMFVSGHGVTRVGETENALVNVIDIYATMMELAGASLAGGMYNSLSFKHLLTGSSSPKRRYNYTEIDTNNMGEHIQGYAIRDSIYKLIEYYDGQQEMYDLVSDTMELSDLLLGSLTSQQQSIKADLESEAAQIQAAWSCNDDIKNGDEDGIDCGGTYCTPCNTISIKHKKSNRDLSVFPNPVGNYFTIDPDGKLIQEIKIFNVLGELLLSKEINNSSATTIDISYLESSVYFLHVKLIEETRVIKIKKDTISKK